MTVQADSKKLESNIESSFLYKVLMIDGIFAAVSGLGTVLGAHLILGLFDLQNQISLYIIGALVLLYGIGLLILAKSESDNRTVAKAAVILNFSWAALSYLGLLLGWFEVNTAGKWAIALVADAVFVFGILEFIGLRRQRKAIGRGLT